MVDQANTWTLFQAFLERRARKLSDEEARGGAAAQACCQQLRDGGRVQLQRLDAHLQKEARSFLVGLDPQLRIDRVVQRTPADVEQFRAWAPQLFAVDDAHRDLLLLNEAVRLFNRYNTAEKTYLFLYILAERVPELARMPAYRKLLAAGASQALRRFFMDLRVECRLTTRHLTDDAAQKLAQELGETEAALRIRIEELEWQLEDSQRQLEELRQGALEEGLFRLTRALQSRAVPVLDQLHQVVSRLRQLPEPDSEQLRVLIALEEWDTALEELGLKRFPPDEGPFELNEAELSDYQYVSGRPFDGQQVRRVRAVAPGWRVGNRLIAPARVCEVEGDDDEHRGIAGPG